MPCISHISAPYEVEMRCFWGLLPTFLEACYWRKGGLLSCRLSAPPSLSAAAAAGSSSKTGTIVGAAAAAAACKDGRGR